MSKKLEQVLEYLIADQQDKAKALLHQVFIEKARKIHEELMTQDEMDEEASMGGDEGDHLKHDMMGHDDHLDEISNEIDAEETMSEDENDADMMDMEEPDMGDDMADDDMSDMDMGSDDMEMGGEEEHGEMSSIEGTIGDLEDALAELKAEFEKLEAAEKGEESGEESDDEDSEEEDSEEEDSEEGDEESEEDDEESEEDEEDDEEEMDESWLEEDFDDLAEAIELTKVSVPAGGEVGSGKGQGAPAEKARSPIATSQTARMGAKPIKTDEKKHSGYNRETAPSSKEMGLTNRRKTAETGMSKMSREGDSSAKLNKTKSEFGADTVGKDSPLSKSPRK